MRLQEEFEYDDFSYILVNECHLIGPWLGCQSDYCDSDDSPLDDGEVDLPYLISPSLVRTFKGSSSPKSFTCSS